MKPMRFALPWDLIASFSSDIPSGALSLRNTHCVMASTWTAWFYVTQRLS
jgi:hypothetical protein